MRIAYVVSLFPKLSETFILREMLALKRRGHQVTVFSLKNTPEELVHPEAQAFAADTVRVGFGPGIILAMARVVLRRPSALAEIVARIVMAHRRRPILLIKNLALVPAATCFAQRIRSLRIEHIHAHWATYPAMVAWIVSRLTGIPYSVTGHAHDLFLPNPMLVRKVKDAKFFATISEFNRALLYQACGPDAMGKVRLIRCGLPLEEFSFVQHRSAPSGALPRVLSVGRLVEYKGFDILIRACARLRECGRRVRCVIVGDGPERARLHRLVAELHLEEEVNLRGSRTQAEVREMMGASDLFVLACIRGADGQQDGIPIVLMEAMALGVPVVSTKLSGIPELVKDGETGLLAAPGDADHLASAMQRILDDPALAESMRTAARAWVEKEFDLRRSVTYLCDAFTQGREDRAE
ncbi:MAG: glycosyltransferase [Acidobacteriota bacterium]